MPTKEKDKDLAFRVHGGVTVNGDIRHDASINLINVRALRAKSKAPELRAYVFGLSLVALLYEQDYMLRQDCQLVLDSMRADERAKQAAEKNLAYGRHRLALVTRDGAENALEISFSAAREFAETAAVNLGIDQSELIVTFDPSKMRTAIKATTDDGEMEASS